MKKQKAFSLIELSIVILVIGILIAGITQGTRLVRESRVKTAQSLTQSSPVINTPNLLIWFESTMDESFLTAQLEDNTQLSQWNERHPRALTGARYYGVKTASAHATYETDGINGIPSVRFTGATGANAFFAVSTTTSAADNIVFVPASNAYTLFMVARIDASDSLGRYIFNNGHGANNGFAYFWDGATAGGTRSIVHGAHAVAAGGVSTKSPEIVTLAYSGTVSSTATLYINGVNTALDVSVFGMNAPNFSHVTFPARARIGAGGSTGADPWQGLISEIILFEGVMKTADRQDIEKYLGKKYAIKVTSS